MRGAASVEMATAVAPAAESATLMVSVFAMPTDRPATERGASVPNGCGDPST